MVKEKSVSRIEVDLLEAKNWFIKTYDAETFNPDQSTHDPDMVKFDQDLFNWYKKFIDLRNRYVSIRLGNYTTLATVDARKLYAFSRKYGNEEVIVIINRGSQPVSFTHSSLKSSKFKDAFTKETVRETKVPAMGIVVFIKKP